jgi:uncharacterized MnhB-related membrane protein
MKHLETIILFLCIPFCLTTVMAQNALNTIGLTGATPAASSYSLRKMSSDYNGPLVRITIGTNYYDVYADADGKFSKNSQISNVITSSSAATSPFTTNLLDSIITAGVTTATVATWYDQSGNANNAVQPTTANQPRIINLGTIETLNGMPTLRFVGSNSHFMESANSVSISGASSVNAVSSSISSTANTASIVTTRAVTAKDGSSSENAAISAAQIKLDYPSKPDGVYWIDLPTAGPTQIYCLMSSTYDGGGWMLAMKAAATVMNPATEGTFKYASAYWTAVNTLNPTEVNRNNGDAKYHVMNYFQAKDMMAVWPDISNSGAESGSIDNLTNWTWLQNNFHNSGSRTTLISKFSGAQVAYETSTSGTMNFSGFGSSAFTKQQGFTFYGINYTTLANASVRWGFAWNNETNQSSNDVSGGIGMGSNYGNFSAGDKRNCCEYPTNVLGVNRSARVEVYIR